MDAPRASIGFSHFTLRLRANVLGMRGMSSRRRRFPIRGHVLHRLLDFRGQQIPPSYYGLPKQSKNLSFLDNLYHNVPRYGRWDRGWLALVEDYSRRKLTRAEDKLPALSGLAKLLAQRTGDGYLAMLWYGHIIEDLFWRVYAREEHLKVGDPGPNMEKNYGKTLSDVLRPKNYRLRLWVGILSFLICKSTIWLL